MCHVLYLTTSTWYIHDYVGYWWPDFVTFHPSCTQYFLASYIGRYHKLEQYIGVLPTANTANVWGSIALFISIVYHRVQTTEYAPVLTYRHLFLHTTCDDLADPIPAPHMPNSNMADPPLGRRGPFFSLSILHLVCIKISFDLGCRAIGVLLLLYCLLC